jgi:catechol 2,3-dioxygenase-like lactoylglutathione lyase family enzyme
VRRAPLYPILLLGIVNGGLSQQRIPRPKITGIDHVDFYTTSSQANEHLYTIVLGVPGVPPLEPGQTQRFMIGSQWVGYSPALAAQATNRMDHLAFRTDDCEVLRLYLSTKGLTVPDSVSKLKEGSLAFTVKDPEGNAIEFVQPSRAKLVKIYRTEDMGKIATPDPVSRRIIHAGFIVRDRAAEDHFYKDILGFHLYWHGGMKADETDWVAMQVPDGTDWVEYMLNVKADADQHTMGVMNHVSLGVKDIKQAQAKLESHSWKPHGDEKAQMGRDGKWQLNLYDPDFTRIELMEFKPVQKPCCSEFQGSHPSE